MGAPGLCVILIFTVCPVITVQFNRKDSESPSKNRKLWYVSAISPEKAWSLRDR